MNLVERETTTEMRDRRQTLFIPFSTPLAFILFIPFLPPLLFFSAEKKGVNKSFALLSISLRSSNPLDFYVSLKDDGTKELTKEEIRNRVVSAVCVTIHKIETRADQLCLRVVRKFKNAHQAIKWGVTTRANL